VIVDVLTDNKNRAVSEVRHAFSKNGGNLGAEGAVGWMFTKKGVISLEKEAASEDKLMEIVLESGAEDLNDEGDRWEILCDPKDFEAVTEALKAAKLKTASAEVTKIASTYTKLEGSQANAMIRLLETIEDLDDTQNVYSNFDFDEASLAN
jgi:YebC/PmpR family DNA-binding regulatory protein